MRALVNAEKFEYVGTENRSLTLAPLENAKSFGAARVK
jgi:hypothetical protein